MVTRLKQWLALRPGETKMVLLLGFVLMSNSAALAISNVVSVSGFISQVGVNEILIVWIVDMVLVAMATGVQSLIVDRFERTALLRWMSFGFGLIYVILRMMFVFRVPGWINYSILFLLTEQQWLFFPLIFWILANDIFDMAQSKRLFPLIASGNFIGQTLGLGLAAAAPDLMARMNVETTELLSMNVLIYLIIYVLITESLSHIKPAKRPRQPETLRETLMEGWGFVREVPSFRYLTFAMIAAILGFTIIEFHFLVISDISFKTAESFQTFYSLYSLGAVVAAIFIQTFLTSRIINKFQLKKIFFIFPCVLVGGITWLLIWPTSVISVVGGVTMPRLSKETVDESARKSFQALVPQERRGRVSMFMDSYLFAAGAILGSLILGAVVVIGKWLNISKAYYIYLGIAVMAALLAIWFSLKLYSAYDASLLNWRLKRRQRTSVLDKLEF